MFNRIVRIGRLVRFFQRLLPLLLNLQPSLALFHSPDLFVRYIFLDEKTSNNEV